MLQDMKVKSNLTKNCINFSSDWIRIYAQEKDKLDKLKEELRNDKLVLKRTQEYLMKDQEKFKDEYTDYKIKDSGSPQK
jgi:hypothetical protein